MSYDQFKDKDETIINSNTITELDHTKLDKTNQVIKVFTAPNFTSPVYPIYEFTVMRTDNHVISTSLMF